MALWWPWFPIGTTALMSCALNCRGGGWRGRKGGQLGPEIGQGGLQLCCTSCTDTDYWRAHAYGRSSPFNSSTTSSATLGSTEFPKVFEKLRLDKEVLSEESSAGPLPSSSIVIERAMKVSRAVKICQLTQPIRTEEIFHAEYEKLETERREGARGSRHMAGARISGMWCVDASACARDSNAVLTIDYESSFLQGYREVFIDVEASNSEDRDSLVENLSFTRAAGGDGFSIEAVDDNLCRTSSVSKDDFWSPVEVEEMVVTGQVIDKWRQFQSVMQDPDKQIDDRHFNRCIHHLRSVLSLPRVTTIDKEPMCCEPEQMLGFRGTIEMTLEVNMDDENNGIVSRTSGYDECFFHKPFLYLWNGFWVGPGDEDGWGFVEALVSPVDIDGLLDVTE